MNRRVLEGEIFREQLCHTALGGWRVGRWRAVRGTLSLMNIALQKTLNVTTVHITHDREEAAAFTDRVALRREGIIEQVSAPDILAARLKDKIGEENK